jgi:guanylate kinase
MTREEFLAQLPELVKNYKPAPDVLKQINNLEVLMVIGPSGVGKTTLIDNSGLAFAPSDTTRPPRPGEQEGSDFYFRTDYDQLLNEIKNGRFVQVAIGSGGDFYSTKDTSYPSSGVVIKEVMANVTPIFQGLGFKSTISSFITPPSYKEWMTRLADHNLSADQLSKRLAEAQRSIEFALNQPNMHFILADTIEAAEQQLLNLLINKVDEARESQAKQAAFTLLAELKKAGQN